MTDIYGDVADRFPCRVHHAARCRIPTAQADALASQTSTVIPTLFTGEGTATMSLSLETATDQGATSAVSQFRILFDLLTPHSFVLTGVLTDDSANFEGFATLSFGTFSFQADNETVLLNETGVLGPGYDFTAKAQVSTGLETGPKTGLALTARFDFDFALTDLGTGQVPEPATLTLLVLGIGVAGFRVARGRRTKVA